MCRTTIKEVKGPCSICEKNVNKNHLAIECSQCQLWSHIKCNDIDKTQYREFQLKPYLSFDCLKCKAEILPFTMLNDYEFDSSVKKGENFLNSHIQHPKFIPTLTQQEMFDKLNKHIEEYNNRVINNEEECNYNQTFNCNYYGVNEFMNCKFNSSKNFSILHLNIHSIQLHIDELKTLLKMLDHDFDIIAIYLKVN